MNKYKDKYYLLQKNVEQQIRKEFDRLGLDKIDLRFTLLNNDEEIASLPFFTKVSKHGFYNEYSIQTIRKQDDEIILEGIENGEIQDFDSISLSEMQDLYSLCDIADRLSQL